MRLEALHAPDLPQVRARVDGVVLKREFREGVEVRAGQRLFKIDPAPYLTTLESARATRGRAAEATAAQALAMRELNGRLSNGELLSGLGMLRAVLRRWMPRQAVACRATCGMPRRSRKAIGPTWRRGGSRAGSRRSRW